MELQLSWSDIPCSFPPEKRKMAASKVSSLLSGLESYKAATARAALSMSREDLERISCTEVPLGLYNRLMAGLEKTVANPLPDVYISLGMRFGNILPEDHLAHALHVLESHSVFSIEDAASEPLLLAQLPPAVRAWLQRKDPIGHRDLTDDVDALVEGELVKAAGKSSDGGATMKKSFKKFSLVGCTAPIPGDKAKKSVSLTIKPPVGGWKGLGLKAKVASKTKGTQGGPAKEDVVVTARVLTAEEQERRKAMAEKTTACIMAVKKGDCGNANKTLCRIILKVLSSIEKKFADVHPLNEELLMTMASPSNSACQLVIERISGPFVLNPSNFEHFRDSLFLQLNEHFGVDKAALCLVPCTMPQQAVDKKMAEYARLQELKGEGPSDSQERGFSFGAPKNPVLNFFWWMGVFLLMGLSHLGQALYFLFVFPFVMCCCSCCS